MNRDKLLAGLASGLLLLLIGCAAGTKEPKADVARQLESFLEEKMIKVWYPRSLDTLYGGFLSDFEHDWRPSTKQHKMIVTQARHLWALSKIAEYYPDNPSYKKYADHGFDFLKNVMWDKEYGGFHTLRTRDGKMSDTLGYGNEKRTYGNAFAIYALATYANMSKSEEALDLAKETYHWIEEHAYDPELNGYFQYLVQNGDPFHKTQHRSVAADSIRFPYKDQNTTIHLMEAYSKLFRTWPNDTLRRKLDNLLVLVRDTITTEKGTMNLFFHPNWKPVWGNGTKEQPYALDHVSYGHDIETAFLMLDAAEALGKPNDPKTLEVAQKMVNHSMAHGLDSKSGGMVQKGYYINGVPTQVDTTKNWWSQAEALNSLLLFDRLYPNSGYRDQFDALWSYVDQNFLDHEHGGWYEKGIDAEPEFQWAKKAHIWKGPYHTVRGMLLCMDRLKEEPQ